MKTSVIEVHDMLSVLGVDELEKRIGEVPGIESVTVDFAGGSATVRYDETRIKIADIKSAVRQRGYESAAPAGAAEGHNHQGHTGSGTPAAPAPAVPKRAPGAPASAGAQPDKAAPSTTSKPSPVVPSAPPAPVSAAPKSPPDTAAAAPGAHSSDEQHDKMGSEESPVDEETSKKHNMKPPKPPKGLAG